jgi:LPXTG-motif cell wall-anchored protein
VTSPAHAPGPVGEVVQHPNGDSAPATFTFDVVPGAPAITGLAPDHGPYTGGTVVTISGSGFTGTTDVTVGGASVPFTVVDDGTITITTPPHAPGTVPIVVTTPVGATPPASFVYDPGTTVDGVTPGSGPAAGGTTVTVTGGCFTGATAVLFGTTPAASFTVVDDHTIRAVSPAGTGVVDVTVVGVAACGSGTLPGGFRYVDPILGGGTTPTATVTGASGGSGTLASTGSDSGAMTMLGGLAVLLLAAGVLMVLRRTRRA